MTYSTIKSEVKKENDISKDVYSLILKNTFGEKVRNKFTREQVNFLELTRGKGVSNICKTNLKTKWTKKD